MKNDFSAGGLVWDKVGQKLLLVQVENLSGQKVWTFPKGHPENNETPEEAALREVREETGWECSLERLLMDTQYFYTHQGERINKTVRWFLMAPVKQAGTFQVEEIMDCRWVDIKDTPSLISYDSDKSLLTKLGTLL